VQGLHDGDVCFLSSIVYGWRKNREYIVKMGHLNALSPNDYLQVFVGALVPKQRSDKAELAEIANIIVMGGILHNVMSKLSKEVCLGCEHGVFAAGLLVIVMDEKNVQDT
jgi:hypothetical protein